MEYFKCSRGAQRAGNFSPCGLCGIIACLFGTHAQLHEVHQCSLMPLALAEVCILVRDGIFQVQPWCAAGWELLYMRTVWVHCTHLAYTDIFARAPPVVLEVCSAGRGKHTGTRWNISSAAVASSGLGTSPHAACVGSLRVSSV